MKSDVLNCHEQWWSRASVFYSGSARVESWSAFRLSYGFRTPGAGKFRNTSSGLVTVSSFHDISNSSVSRNALDYECVADVSCRYEAVITYRCFGRHCSAADCTVFLWGYVIYTDRSVKLCFSRFTQPDLAKVHWYVLHAVGLVKTTCVFVTWSPLHWRWYVTHSRSLPIDFCVPRRAAGTNRFILSSGI